MIDSLFNQNALLFTVPALAGTAVFLLKMGLMTLGGVGGDVDLDVDADVDVDTGASDSTDAFNLLSIQSIAAFMMGFGWGGLGGIIGLDWALPRTLLLAAASGTAMVWLLGWIFKAVYDLQDSGTIDVREAIGRTGTVYSNVPPCGDGRGQVRVVIRDNAKIYNAVSAGEPVATGTAVTVVEVDADRTLRVVPT